jgi:hypothetical protein
MVAGKMAARTWNPPAGVEQYTEFDCLDYKDVSSRISLPLGITTELFFQNPRSSKLLH